MSNHRETLLQTVADLTGVSTEELAGRMQLPLADVGLDSLRAQELLARLEDAFDADISPQDAVHLTTLAAIERFVRAQR